MIKEQENNKAIKFNRTSLTEEQFEYGKDVIRRAIKEFNPKENENDSKS